MANPVDELSALIDTPEKAKWLREQLTSVDPNTLSPEDRVGHRLATRALSRWVNSAPTDAKNVIYSEPRAPGDVIDRQMQRGPISNRPITDTDPSGFEHVGAVVGGLADLAGIPTSKKEWKESFTPMAIGKRLLGPIGSAIEMGETAQQYVRGGFKGEEIPIAGPMLVKPVKNIARPVERVMNNEAPTRDESLAATRSGTSTIATLAAARPTLKQMPMKGANTVLNPERTVRTATETVKKNATKVERKFEPQFVENARRMTDAAVADINTVSPPVGPPKPSTPSSRQTAARQAMNAEAASKSAVKMAKRETTHNKKIPDHITRRLAPWIDDAEGRLARGQEFGKATLEKYRKEGIPKNPEVIAADKLKVHEQTQARLQQPDLAAIQVPEEVVINSVMGDTLKKMLSPVGDAPTSHPKLREIVERSNKSGSISVEDFRTLKNMAEGKFEVGFNKKGQPIMGKVPMPSALADTVGYIERLRREFGGRLPSTPAELNSVKAARYQEIADRTFSKDITDADKSLAGVHRGQAYGLRRLVDDITKGPDGRSPVHELNEAYANAATLEEGIRQFNAATRTEQAVSSIPMAGGGATSAHGVARSALSGTGLQTVLPRWVRHWINSPEFGRQYALAHESLAPLWGRSKPPGRPPAQGPTTPPTFNIPPSGPQSPGPQQHGGNQSAGPRQWTPSGPPKGGSSGAAASVPPTNPAGPVQPKPSSPSGPPPSDIQNVLNLARSNKRADAAALDKLWKTEGATLRKKMRKSDVRWVEQKLETYNKREGRVAATAADRQHEKEVMTDIRTARKIQKDSQKAKKDAETAAARTERERIKQQRVDAKTEKEAKKAAKAEADAKKKAATAEPTSPPKQPSEEPVLVNPLETPEMAGELKGDWRKVKKLDDTRPLSGPPPPIEKPTGNVATESVSFDSYDIPALEKKRKELSIVRENAEKKGNTALVERTNAMMAAVEKTLQDRGNGVKPTTESAATAIDDDAEFNSDLGTTGTPELNLDAVAVQIQSMIDEASKNPNTKRSQQLLDEAVVLADKLKQMKEARDKK